MRCAAFKKSECVAIVQNKSELALEIVALVKMEVNARYARISALESSVSGNWILVAHLARLLKQYCQSGV